MKIHFVRKYGNCRTGWFVSEKGYHIIYVSGQKQQPHVEIILRTPAVSDNGIAHITEHCVCSGNERTGNLSVLTKSNKNILYFNAMVSELTRTTKFFAQTSSNESNLTVLKTLADAVFNPALTDDTFRTQSWNVTESNGEKKLGGVVLAEMLNAKKIPEDIVHNAYEGNAIGTKSGGTLSGILTTTPEMVREFHKQYYCPDNCAIVICGTEDFDSDYLKSIDDCLPDIDRHVDREKLIDDLKTTLKSNFNAECTGESKEFYTAVYHMDVSSQVMLTNNNSVSRVASLTVRNIPEIKGFTHSKIKPVNVFPTSEGLIATIKYYRKNDKAVFDERRLRKRTPEFLRKFNKLYKKGKILYPQNADVLQTIETCFANLKDMEKALSEKDDYENTQYSFSSFKYVGVIHFNKKEESKSNKNIIEDFLKTAEVTPFTPEIAELNQDKDVGLKEFVPTEYTIGDDNIYYINNNSTQYGTMTMCIDMDKLSVKECQDLMLFVDVLNNRSDSINTLLLIDTTNGTKGIFGIKFLRKDEEDYFKKLYKLMKGIKYVSKKEREHIIHKNGATIHTISNDTKVAQMFVSVNDRCFNIRKDMYVDYLESLGLLKFNLAVHHGYKVFRKSEQVVMRSTPDDYDGKGESEFLSHFKVVRGNFAEYNNEPQNKEVNKIVNRKVKTDAYSIYEVPFNGTIQEKTAMGILFYSIGTHELWEGLRNTGLVYSEYIKANDIPGRYCVCTVRDKDSTVTIQRIEEILKSLKDKQWTQQEINEALAVYKPFSKEQEFAFTVIYILYGITNEYRMEVYNIKKNLTPEDMHAASVKLSEIIESGNVVKVYRSHKA